MRSTERLKKLYWVKSARKKSMISEEIKDQDPFVESPKVRTSLPDEEVKEAYQEVQQIEMVSMPRVHDEGAQVKHTDQSGAGKPYDGTDPSVTSMPSKHSTRAKTDTVLVNVVEASREISSIENVSDADQEA